MSTEITQLVNAWRNGSPEALDALMESVYDELKIIARARLRRGPTNTINATAVVNEVYLKLVGMDPSGQSPWNNRHEFFALVSKIMLRFLLDEQKRKQRQKHGGEMLRVTLEPGSDELQKPSQPLDAMILSKALEVLESLNYRQCRLWQCRYLCGLSITELSETFKLGVSTVHRELKTANGWIRARMA